MSYEGEFLSMIKKLLHPYWRLLAHTLVMCVARNKGGLEQLSRRLTSTMVALTLNWYSTILNISLKNCWEI